MRCSVGPRERSDIKKNAKPEGNRAKTKTGNLHSVATGKTARKSENAEGEAAPGEHGTLSESGKKANKQGKNPPKAKTLAML